MLQRTVLTLAVVAFVAVVLNAPMAGSDIDRFRSWTGPTPALELSDLADAPHTLAEYQGRVVLLNFWATWCVPCRDEMPSLQKLLQRLSGQPFAILAVNYGESRSRIDGFVGSMSLTFPILRDPRHEAVTAWRVRTLPASFLVGPDGRVRYWVVGELDWAADDVVARVRRLLP
jgi:thiol-disulfide isomerase/thioredoxin